MFNLTYISEYIDDLIREVVVACETVSTERPSMGLEAPPFLCADFEKPDKEEAIRAHTSRFTK